MSTGTRVALIAIGVPPMFSLNLSTRQGDGHVIVALRGELDMVGLDFTDSSGVAALACGRKHARIAGGDLLLVAPVAGSPGLLLVT